jgi:hypothetical protein
LLPGLPSYRTAHACHTCYTWNEEMHRIVHTRRTLPGCKGSAMKPVGNLYPTRHACFLPQRHRTSCKWRPPRTTSLYPPTHISRIRKRCRPSVDLTVSRHQSDRWSGPPIRSGRQDKLINAHPLISATPALHRREGAEPTEDFLKETVSMHPCPSVNLSLPSLVHPLHRPQLIPCLRGLTYAVNGVLEDCEEQCGKLTSSTAILASSIC